MPFSRSIVRSSSLAKDIKKYISANIYALKAQKVSFLGIIYLFVTEVYLKENKYSILRAYACSQYVLWLSRLC